MRMRLALAAACAGVLLVLACGPTARPGAPRTADDPALASIDASDRGVGATTSAAPIAQLFGGPVQPAGRLLFVRDGNLWMWEKGNAFEIGVGYTWYQPRWAPDGSRIAYVYRAANFSDIFVTDPRGSSQVRLTRSQSPVLGDNDWNFRPTWSPDGRQIAYVSDVDSFYPTLWVMNADGTGRRPVATIGFQQEIADDMSWSPDGSQLAVSLFSAGDRSQVALVPMAAATRQQTRVVTNEPGGAMDPAWSPDGRWLAYAARAGRGVEVFVMRTDGTGRQQVSQGGMVRAPAWSPDGKHLAYLSSKPGAFEVFATEVRDAGGTLDFRNERQLTRDLGLEAPSGLSWAR